MASLPKIVTLCATCLPLGAAIFQVDQATFAVASEISSAGGFSVDVALQSNSDEPLSSAAFELTGAFVPLTFNHPPFAAPDVFARPANDDLKIELRQLLTNDFDSDADSFSIQVASTSASGVPITVAGGWIYYRHASSAPDSFSYTITDSFGAISLGRVDILIGDPNSEFSTFLRIAADESGAHINFNGIPNRTYVIQSRDTLETPWTDRGSATDAGLGRFHFDDNTGNETRFYRVVYRP